MSSGLLQGSDFRVEFGANFSTENSLFNGNLQGIFAERAVLAKSDAKSRRRPPAEEASVQSADDGPDKEDFDQDEPDQPPHRIDSLA